MKTCNTCIYKNLEGYEYPCFNCFDFNKYVEDGTLLEKYNNKEANNEKQN